MNMLLSREFYIPRGAVKVADKLSDAVAYLYTTHNGKPAAMGFHGKAQKPDWRFYYLNAEAREKAVRTHFAKWQAMARLREEQKATRQKPSKLQIGHVLVASWGYEQTNIDWFQVTAVISPTMVEIRELGARNVEDTGWAQGRSVPAIDTFTGEPLRRRVKYGDSVKVDTCRTAHLWDGRPRHWTAYH